MTSLSTDLLTLLELQRALSFAAEEEEGQWRTIGGHPGPGGQHVGGQHVKIGEGGNIEAGPKSLEGQNVSDLSNHPNHPLFDKKTGRAFSGGKSKPKAKDLKAAEAAYANALTQYGPNNQATIRAEMKYRELKEGAAKSKIAPQPEASAQATEPQMQPWVKEQYDKIAPGMEKQLDREVAPHRKAVVVDEFMRGEPPDVQKALAQRVMQIAPEVKDHIRSLDGRKVFAQLSKESNVTPHPPQPQSNAGNAAPAGEAVAEREPGAEPGAVNPDEGHSGTAQADVGGNEPTQGGPEQWKQAADQSLTPDEKQRMEENYRHGVYLVNMPVSMLTPGNKATAGGMANLEKFGGNPNPGVVNMRKSVNGETEYFVDDGNHRLEYAKRKGQATIPMYVAPDRDVDINELASKLGGEQAAPQQSPGNADVDVSRQFGLFAKDKSGAPVEVGERAGQANLFNPSKYKTAEKPVEAPDDEAGVKVKTNEMFPVKEGGNAENAGTGNVAANGGGNVSANPPVPETEGVENRATGSGRSESGSAPSAPPVQPQPPVPGEGAEEKEAAGKVDFEGLGFQLGEGTGSVMPTTMEATYAMPAIRAEIQRRVNRDPANVDWKIAQQNALEDLKNNPNGPFANSVRQAVADEKARIQGIKDEDELTARGEHPEQIRQRQRDSGKVESGHEQKEPAGLRDSGEGASGNDTRVQADTGAVGEVSEGEPRSEQEIAQAVNRGEMSVEDVLESHPHLAGDALVEQHRREQREAAEAAEAEREAEDNAEGMGAEGAGEVPDFMEGLEEPGGTQEPQAAEPEPTPPPAPKPPKPAKTGKKQRPKGMLEQTLLDNYERENADQEMADDEALADFHHPFTFKRDPKTKSGFPGEVERFLEGAPKGVKRLFELTDSATGGQGADAMGKLGEDEYFELAGRRGGMTGKLRAAIEAGKKSNDPQVQWAASYYDLDKPEGKGKTQKANPKDWMTGTTATVKGVPVEVVKDDEGHRSLKDGGELPELPLDAIDGPLPFDKGSVKPGKPSFEESGKWSPSKTNSAEKMAESLINDPAVSQRMTEKKPEKAIAPEAMGDVFPDVEQPEAEPSTTPGADPIPTGENEPETPVESLESPISEEKRPSTGSTATTSPPPEQTPQEVQADIQGGLAALGMNIRQAEALAQAAMESGQAMDAVSGIKWALMNPTATPKPPAPSGLPQMQMRPPSVEQLAAQKLTGPPKGVKAPPTAQQLRQSAQLPQPPSKLPVTPHQPPPAKIKRSAQATSALAAANPVHVGKTPHIRGQSLPHLPTGRAPATPRLPSVASQIHKSRFGTHAPRTTMRNTIGQQPGQTRPVKVHAGRGMSQSEIDRAKGRELKELFSADADESLARTLSLLEMLT